MCLCTPVPESVPVCLCTCVHITVRIVVPTAVPITELAVISSIEIVTWFNIKLYPSNVNMTLL